MPPLIQNWVNSLGFRAQEGLSLEALVVQGVPGFEPEQSQSEGLTWLRVLWWPLGKTVSLHYVYVSALPGSDLCMCPTGRTVWSSF